MNRASFWLAWKGGAQTIGSRGRVNWHMYDYDYGRYRREMGKIMYGVLTGSTCDILEMIGDCIE
jgi:hypothetical protein